MLYTVLSCDLSIGSVSSQIGLDTTVTPPSFIGSHQVYSCNREKSPAGYRYHDLRGRVGVLPSHLDLVQSLTHIPRSRAQLSVMPGVAVYWDGEGSGNERRSDIDDEMPIAWAFLGLDGPVATLHVEPEHRGKGLGLALCKETMRRGVDVNGVFGAARAGIEGDLADRMGDWVHTEVAQFNKASQRVMKKIRGEVLTTVMWTVIEVVD